MERVIITGASGFIGKAITKILAEEDKYEIYAITTGRRKVEFHDKVNVVKANLLLMKDRERVIEDIKPDYIIHLAWNLGGNNSFLDSNDNLEWLEASISLLKLFTKYKGKRFVFAGSSSEYEIFSSKEVGKLSENSLSLYGECKLAFTNLASNFCKINKLSYVTARYFSVYGEYDDREARALPLAINTFIKGEKFVCKSPNSIWDYIYIEDAARATIKIMESYYQGVVNVASGVPRTMKDIFLIVAKKMKNEKNLYFENEEKCGDILVGDNKVLVEKVGFINKYTLEEGIDRTIEWCLNRI